MAGLQPDGAPRSDRAFVTLVTNGDYARGARALVRSIRLSGTDADIVVLHTDVAAGDLAPLSALGARLVRCALLPTSDAFNATHARDALHGRAAFTKGDKPPFHTPLDNFAKLRLWQLDYARVVFIDADALVLQNVDKLFEYPQFCAAPNVYESLADFHRLNSGVFTARPSQSTFDDMLERLDAPGVVLAPHRPDVPGKLFSRLARPAGVHEHAAICMVQPARPVALGGCEDPAFPV